MIERREYEMDLIEVRAAEDGEELIRGHAAVFNKKSQDLMGFKEVIEPGAFAESIEKDDIRALFNHDFNFVLGRNRSGTLSLSEDKRGLYYEINPPQTSFANDLMESIRRKDITQSSFGFSTIADDWEGTEKAPIRRLLKAKLYDVSPVTFPAYLQTDVKVRGLMKAYGLSPELWGQTMFKMRKGIALSSEERDYIQEAIALMKRALESTVLGEAAGCDPEEESPDGEDVQRHITLGRMRMLEMEALKHRVIN